MGIKQYKFGFDFPAFVLFLLIMLPNFIWFAAARKNRLAAGLASVFTLLHLIHGLTVLL